MLGDPCVKAKVGSEVENNITPNTKDANKVRSRSKLSAACHSNAAAAAENDPAMDA